MVVIMQWTLFAVRNLCEGNENNQNFISQMQLKGIANSNELLEDFGIQCNVQHGQLTVQSKNKNK